MGVILKRDHSATVGSNWVNVVCPKYDHFAAKTEKGGIYYVTWSRPDGVLGKRWLAWNVAQRGRRNLGERMSFHHDDVLTSDLSNGCVLICIR